jgi:hypothetical protein
MASLMIKSALRSEDVSKTKGGRPVSKSADQLHDLAREFAQEQRRQHEASERRRRILERAKTHDEDYWDLLSFFFAGDLEKWDREDKIPTSMSMRLRFFLSTPTGKTLLQQASHTLIKDIIDAMAADSVNIGGVEWSCYKVYALRVHLKLENPFSEQNELTPNPLPIHIRKAFEEFILLVHDKILNVK